MGKEVLVGNSCCLMAMVLHIKNTEKYTSSVVSYVLMCILASKSVKVLFMPTLQARVEEIEKSTVYIEMCVKYPRVVS